MYRPVVFGSIACLFAWPIVGLLALDIDEDTVVVSEMIAVTVVLLSIDAFWWWQLVFKDYAGPPGAVLEFKFWQSLGLVGIVFARMMMGFSGWKR